MDLHLLSVADIVFRIQSEDRAVFKALETARTSLIAFIQALVPRFERGGRLIYIGAGTSGRLGVLDAAEAPPTFQIAPGRIIGLIAGGDAALRKSSEGKEDDPSGSFEILQELDLHEEDMLLGIASGGTTPYVLGALGFVERLRPKPLTGFLYCSAMNNPPQADHLILIETGPEVLTGSTRMKAGTATKMALNTISTTLMARTGRVYQNLMVDVKASNDKLLDRAGRIVQTLTGVSRKEAFELIERAEGSVKIAALMQLKSIDYGEARRLLEEARGDLGVALGETN